MPPAGLRSRTLRSSPFWTSKETGLRSARRHRDDSDIRPPGIRPRLISSVRAVRVAALDAFLLRSAFIVIGATVGVLGAQSLIILLRTWHIWYPSPAESNIGSIGGACVFGAFKSTSNPCHGYRPCTGLASRFIVKARGSSSWSRNGTHRIGSGRHPGDR